MTTLTLTIHGRLTQDVADFAEASAAYQQARDLSGEGGSTFPFGTIERDGEQVARVSYNGRVWEGDRLVYCPGSVGKDEGRPDVFNAGLESVWGRKCGNPHPAGTVEHIVFERGAARARGALAA